MADQHKQHKLVAYCPPTSRSLKRGGDASFRSSGSSAISWPARNFTASMLLGEPSIAGFSAGFIVADGPSIVLDAQGYRPMPVEFEQHELYSRGIVGRLDVPFSHVPRPIFVRSRRSSDRLES